MVPYFCEQLQILTEIASWRTPWLDPIFCLLNYVDSPYFMMILITFLWTSISWRWGLKVALLMILSTLLNDFLKQMVGWPRPDLAMLSLGPYGFPSNGAQGAMVLGGLLIATFKTRAAWIIGISYILLISFSRLYLGVHYPIDLLGGWLAGLAILFAFLRRAPLIESMIAKWGAPFGLILCIATTFLFVSCTSSHKIHLLAGSWLGFGLGAYLGTKFHLYAPPPHHWKTRIERGALAIASVFLLYLLLPLHGMPFLISCLIALWIALGAPVLTRYLIS